MLNMKEVTDFRNRIINDCVGIANALKGMFGVIYKYDLTKDRKYLANEKELAKNALDILTVFVTNTDDPEVIEAFEYLSMVCNEE